ncbi:hypothetical protein QE370_003478 [Aeromicrobium sp. SORGH_AS981]|uniref:hypothetical protein n=1 Tax=Aeromicrobium sp. SORGH_AS_0981 TaxID=3041802 RepID=UPI002859DF31|nr:hypothetical protein [Aeromicrobium sp. SORGH_AS_0981]MDR6120294.1 hypothetical protein [Aeromicrobium sp. SORGH_AS_0981]
MSSITTEHDSTNTNENDPYERLLFEMPRIAEVVNAFDSEDVQKSAFDALVSAIGADVAPVLRSIQPATPSEAEGPSDSDESKGRRRRAGKSAKKTFSPTKGLNFAPSGKPTLAEFVAEKAPRNQHERNLLACYYLTEMMGIQEVDVNHVLAVYRAAGWEAPTSPDVSLRVTASRTSWIDTSASSAIKVMWSGDEHIVSKMPSAQPKKDAA